MNITIYIYNNETGLQVGKHTGASNEECESWAAKYYGNDDYHWSYCDQEVSNA
jgi:hypothetical protein